VEATLEATKRTMDSDWRTTDKGANEVQFTFSEADRALTTRDKMPALAGQTSCAVHLLDAATQLERRRAVEATLEATKKTLGSDWCKGAAAESFAKFRERQSSALMPISAAGGSRGASTSSCAPASSACTKQPNFSALRFEVAEDGFEVETWDASPPRVCGLTQDTPPPQACQRRNLRWPVVLRSGRAVQASEGSGGGMGGVQDSAQGIAPQAAVESAAGDDDALRTILQQMQQQMCAMQQQLQAVCGMMHQQHKMEALLPGMQITPPRARFRLRISPFRAQTLVS